MTRSGVHVSALCNMKTFAFCHNKHEILQSFHNVIREDCNKNSCFVSTSLFFKRLKPYQSHQITKTKNKNDIVEVCESYSLVSK